MHPNTLPHIRTERLLLKLLEPHRSDLMFNFRIDNRIYLKPWEPLRPAEFFTRGFWDYQLRHAIQDYRDGNSLCLVIMDGADEVDMVADLASVIEGDANYLRQDFEAVLKVCRSMKPHVPLKVIIESAAINDEQIRFVCGIAQQAGVDFLKTSTGFHKAGW